MNIPIYLTLRTFPSLSQLWSNLAETRKLRRNLIWKAEDRAKNLGIKSVKKMLLKLAEHEKIVMEKIAIGKDWPQNF